jgi:hypothetical protein
LADSVKQYLGQESYNYCKDKQNRNTIPMQMSLL